MNDSLDSKEEMYFSWYLDELQQHGFIESYEYQPKVFRITDPIYAKQLIIGKKSTKIRTSMLLREHEYRADYSINWNRKGNGIFYALLSNILSGVLSDKFIETPFIANENNDKYFSVVDVKGTYNQNDAYRRFAIDQKLVMQKFGIYVQKIIPSPVISKTGKMSHPNALFIKTFVPNRYILTDKKTKTRKIKYEFRTIEQYLKIKNSLKNTQFDQVNYGNTMETIPDCM